jgi:hypothetical protein
MSWSVIDIVELNMRSGFCFHRSVANQSCRPCSVLESHCPVVGRGNSLFFRLIHCAK